MQKESVMLLRVKIFSQYSYQITSARALKAVLDWGQPGARALEDSGYQGIALGRPLALHGNIVSRTEASGIECFGGGDG